MVMPAINSMAGVGIAAIAAGVVLYIYEKERQRLEQQLQLANEKREVERRGRVKAEQAMRKSIKAKRRERRARFFYHWYYSVLLSYSQRLPKTTSIGAQRPCRVEVG